MKIVITARNFSINNKKAIDLLINNGFEVIDYSDMNMGTGTTEKEVLDLISDADVAITGLEPIGKEVIEKCNNLKMISRRSIGYDSVDLQECLENNIAVTRVTGTVEAAVAEHVMAYILYFARHIDMQNESLHKGQWNRYMTLGAKNRTLGLIGFGGIGKEIAKRAIPFGMNVVYYCRHPKEQWEDKYKVKYSSMDKILSESDYISVNVPLSDDTKGMFSEEEFYKMKRNSVFINIARAEIVDTLALKKALDNKWIRGAAIDVFDKEPCLDSPLISCKNAVLTPHTAPFTSENFSEMNMRAAQNVIDFFNKTLDNKYRLV